ncbi:hypothetical protein PALB_19090 [Pseudoalteromonas luteoviolacea B = ATCC 29581]|nr:hypothetical protein PALB_19090 [Pseudoalteromonas luteoviolacea B = ATCC 29581]
MTIKFCPSCLTYAEIKHEILSEDQEEYLLHFSGEEKCPNCDYTVTFSGTADIHEGQSTRNLDDFLMGEEFYPPEKGVFYLPESYLLDDSVTYILYEGEDLGVFSRIANEIEGSETLNSQRNAKVLQGIGELVKSNERKYLFSCDVCNHLDVCNFIIDEGLGLVMQCPKCETVEQVKLNRNDEAGRLTVTLGKGQYLFNFIGHTDKDGFKNSSDTHNCARCHVDNMQEIQFTKISENDKPHNVRYEQCANCSFGFYDGFAFS